MIIIVPTLAVIRLAQTTGHEDSTRYNILLIEKLLKIFEKYLKKTFKKL
jgi:hypothetical protein